MLHLNVLCFISQKLISYWLIRISQELASLHYIRTLISGGLCSCNDTIRACLSHCSALHSVTDSARLQRDAGQQDNICYDHLQEHSQYETQLLRSSQRFVVDLLTMKPFCLDVLSSHWLQKKFEL